MTQGFSIYLNLLRFCAAFLVLVSHFAYPRFTGGRWIWVRDLNLGSDAVILFFVLSGFVIALVADQKKTGFEGFAFDRLTRLMSVALPALVLGFVLDRTGAQISAQTYDNWFYNPLSFTEQMIRGLTFSNEWSGLATRLGTNGPYWSLSYEAAFYALFAVAYYLCGLRRIVLLVLGLWIFGLNILLLMPAWIMGVVLYHRLSRHKGMPRGRALVCMLMPVLIYGAALWLDVPAKLMALTEPVNQFFGLRFSDEFVWNGMLGVLVVTHLIGMAALLNDRSFAKVAPLVAWLAGGSFSLYLVHYPVLQYLSVALPKVSPPDGNDAILLIITVLVCFAFAQVFERPLHIWRRGLRKLTWRLTRKHMQTSI